MTKLTNIPERVLPERKPSDVLDRLPLGTAEEERNRAKLWMDTAAQHTSKEEYWRILAMKAEERCEVLRSMAQDLRRASVYGSYAAFNLCPSSTIEKARDVVEWAEQTSDLAERAYQLLHQETTDEQVNSGNQASIGGELDRPVRMDVIPCATCSRISQSVCTECSEHHFDGYQGPQK